MIGQTIKQYIVEDVLGKGGMGTVYRARDTRLQRQAALKVLPADLTADPDRRHRFFQEARSAAAITHPAIAQVYDVDEVDGITFIAMELVEGKTVRQLISDKDLDLLSSLDIAIQVGEGLARAHETGIVHRDIKSENIMVTRDGHAKILDFGLAKLSPLQNVDSGKGTEEHMSRLATVAQTQAGMVMGTVAYMSPEQARGRSVDHRSDIFSLGIVIYEMATGRLPFSGDSPLDTMHAIAFEEIQPVTSVRQNLPPGLQRIVSRCLRKRPEDRYQDARSLVEDLKALRKDIDSGVTRAIPIGDRIREGIESIRGFQGSTLIWLAIIAGILFLGFILWLVGKRGDIWWLVSLVVVGMWLYRYYRYRGRRLLKRFVTKVSRFPEVKLISFQKNRATVVVDRMQARTYLRVNSLIEAANKKLYFGEPMVAAIRDDVGSEEFRRMLQEPGVLYIREDAFDSEGRKVT
ncbi:MAG TPA: serine/threonine-protein kinase [Acidobacteriota bacterium]|nr:serine/threonine-protein kinase [Acidobacteriota bacterium]